MRAPSRRSSSAGPKSPPCSSRRSARPPARPPEAAGLALTVDERPLVSPVAAHPLRVRLAFGALATRKVALSAVALWLFVIAIRTLSRGARGIEPLLDTLDVTSPANALGFAW